jgi:hypothetical protein
MHPKEFKKIVISEQLEIYTLKIKECRKKLKKLLKEKLDLIDVYNKLNKEDNEK